MRGIIKSAVRVESAIIKKISLEWVFWKTTGKSHTCLYATVLFYTDCVTIGPINLFTNL